MPIILFTLQVVVRMLNIFWRSRQFALIKMNSDPLLLVTRSQVGLSHLPGHDLTSYHQSDLLI